MNQRQTERKLAIQKDVDAVFRATLRLQGCDCSCHSRNGIDLLHPILVHSGAGAWAGVRFRQYITIDAPGRARLRSQGVMLAFGPGHILRDGAPMNLAGVFLRCGDSCAFEVGAHAARSGHIWRHALWGGIAVARLGFSWTWSPCCARGFAIDLRKCVSAAKAGCITLRNCAGCEMIAQSAHAQAGKTLRASYAERWLSTKRRRRGGPTLTLVLIYIRDQREPLNVCPTPALRK